MDFKDVITIIAPLIFISIFVIHIKVQGISVGLRLRSKFNLSFRFQIRIDIQRNSNWRHYHVNGIIIIDFLFHCSLVRSTMLLDELRLIKGKQSSNKDASSCVLSLCELLLSAMQAMHLCRSCGLN